MKAIVLAAGRGSRMANLTSDRPKCLTRIAGKPLLFWQLEALAGAGLREVAVVCGYRAEAIAAERDAAPVPFHILVNDKWADTNMLSTLAHSMEWAAGDECIVSYSDIVYPAGHVTALLAAQGPFAVAYDSKWQELWRMRQEDPLIDAETFRAEGGKLLEIGGVPRSLDEVQGQYMGLIKINPSGWTLLETTRRMLGEEFDRMDMTGYFRHLLSMDTFIGAVPMSGAWCEVDNESDLKIYELALANLPWSHDWRTDFV